MTIFIFLVGNHKLSNAITFTLSLSKQCKDPYECWFGKKN